MIKRLACLALALMLATAPALAQEAQDTQDVFAATAAGTGPGPGKGRVTGLPVPRFVSLRSDQVNVRAGPGFQYPIVWVYKRAELPVEITDEFDVWRKILAPDGGTGWVHEATVRSQRGFIVIGGKQTLRGGPSDDAGAVAVLDPGLVGRIAACKPASAWCRVIVRRLSGFLPRTAFWGTFPGEDVH